MSQIKFFKIKGNKNFNKKKVVYLVWTENLNDDEFKNFCKEVESAYSDPNYSLISNFQINIKVIELNKNIKFNIVNSLDINEKEVDELKDYVDKALKDPGCVIIAGYEINWEQVQ